MADIIFTAGVIIAVGGAFLSLARFIAGKTTLDRTVAFDTLGIIVTILIVVAAHAAGRIIYIDTALIYGLVSFLGVIVVARYFERGL